MCHLAHNCLHHVHLMLGDVKAHKGDVMGLPRPTFRAEARSPGSRLAKVPLVERPSFSPVQASGICLPLAGVSASTWWDFSPMEVPANHLPICTCLSGMVLQQQQVRPPWAHKS
jgi:hypothetical protein